MVWLLRQQNQFLYEHVLYKVITHHFISVKELNQPHKSILTVVSIT